MSFSITKQFEFCYGHRVWTQELDSRMALTTHCKCRHLHGHQGRVTVRLSSAELDAAGMVMDFSHLAWLKQLIDQVIDHKLILDCNDPFFGYLKRLIRCEYHLEESVFFDFEYDRATEELTARLARSFVMPELVRGTVLEEIYGGIVLVDFVPTSEHLAKFFYDLVNARLNQFFANQNFRPVVEEVVFHETPKTSAAYRPAAV